MTKTMHKLFALSLMMAAACGSLGPGGSYPYAIPKKTKPSKRYDLPLFIINGHEVHAKDEKTALKYARKRGYLQSNSIEEK